MMLSAHRVRPISGAGQVLARVMQISLLSSPAIEGQSMRQFRVQLRTMMVAIVL